MAEYVLREDEDQTTVVQELLANADHPDHVVWQPRSGVPHGGVYVIDDGLADRMIEHRQAVRDAEARRILEAQEAADARDSAPGVAEGLVTPAEAGFAATQGADPGAPAADEEDDDEPAEDDAAELSDEEWAAKYGDLPRPELEPADETPPANEPAKPANRKSRRKAAPAATAPAPAATAPAADETNPEGSTK